MEVQDASFFDHSNQAGMEARNRALYAALDDMTDWLASGAGPAAWRVAERARQGRAPRRRRQRALLATWLGGRECVRYGQPPADAGLHGCNLQEVCVYLYMCACVRACLRACVRACLRTWLTRMVPVAVRAANLPACRHGPGGHC